MTKKSLTTLIFFAFLSLVFYQCKQEKAENTAKTTNYPNKDSELALLMREMYSDTELIRKAVQEKKMPTDFKEKFEKIHSAIPTDSTVREGDFKLFAQNFLVSLDNVYEQENQIQNYNLLINNCIACHQSVCPGPIKRIKKLKL